MKYPVNILFCVLIASTLAGCGRVRSAYDYYAPDHRKDYRQAQISDKALRIPPGVKHLRVKNTYAIPRAGKRAQTVSILPPTLIHLGD